MITIGEVINIDDINDGGRIKVKLYPQDRYLPESKIEYAFPAMPKMFFVKPKVGEAVIIFTLGGTDYGQRFYIGPIISQPHFLHYDGYVAGATTLLKGGLKPPLKTLQNFPNSQGCFANDEEVAIYSRLNSDIILGDNDIRIRCGARLISNQNEDGITFNKKNPTFIKLKKYDTALEYTNKNIANNSYSTATLVSEDINLISTQGSPYFTTSDKEGSINDKEMAKILENAHYLPYGDVLIDFLTYFWKMFNSHTHKYHNMPPCPDANSMILNANFTLQNLSDKILSKHIRIN